MTTPAQTTKKPTATNERKPRVPISYKKRAERSLASFTRAVNSLERVQRAKVQGSPAQRKAYIDAMTALISRAESSLTLAPGTSNVRSVIPDE